MRPIISKKEQTRKRAGMQHYPLWIPRWEWAKFMSTCKLKGKTGRQVIEDLIKAWTNHNNPNIDD